MVGAHAWAVAPWFYHAMSSISFKWDLAYMLSTKTMTFSSFGQGTPMTMSALALQVSSHMYFVMRRSGVSAHCLQRAALASIFS